MQSVAPYLTNFPSPYILALLSPPPQWVPKDIDAERGTEEMEMVLWQDERNMWSEVLTFSQHFFSPFQQFLHTAKLQVIFMALDIVVDTLGHSTYWSHSPYKKHKC